MKPLTLISAMVCACFFSCRAYGADPVLDFYKQGMTYYQQKDYVQAEKFFQLAAQMNPQDWKAVQMEGYCETMQGHRDLAIQDYEKSLQINPVNPTLSKYVESLRPTGATTLPENYIWDPAVDPYPKYTGFTTPLAKPEIPVCPHVYLTAAYVWGMDSLQCDAVNGDLEYAGNYVDNSTYTSFRVPLRLHFQLDPLVSIALGTDIWPSLTNTASGGSTEAYPFDNTTYIYTEHKTGEVDMTPLSLGLYLHSWGKDISFEYGVNLTAIYFQAKGHDDSLDQYIDTAFPSENENQETITDSNETGWTLGASAEVNMVVKVTPQIGLFITAEGHGFPPWAGQDGFATLTQTTVANDTYPGFPAEDYHNKYTYSYPADTMSLVGFSLGFGIQGGF